IGMLGYHFTSSELRAVLIGLSFGIIYMTTVFRWKLNIPKEDRAKETSWATFIGLILLNAFKWAGMSQNPIWINWYFALCASVITGVVVFLLKDVYLPSEIATITEDLGLKKLKEWGYPTISYAMVVFIGAWMFSSYGVIPRWTGMDPAWGVLITLSLIAGVFYRHLLLIQSGLFGMLGLIGLILMSFESSLIGFIGGLIFAFVLPSYWKIAVDNIKAIPSGKSFLLSGFMFLVFTFGSIFTVTYDYVPLGFLFREREEALLIIAFLLVIFGHFEYLLIKPKILIQSPRRQFLVILALIMIITIPIGSAIRLSHGVDEAESGLTSFTVMTYNIQQGFDEHGDVNFETVAKIIRTSGAHIVGLQETDTLRMSSANRDVTEWLGNDLRMHSYLGPSTRDSTFGNSILSRYDFASTSTEILPSDGELAVLQSTTITINGTQVYILNAHLGETEKDRTQQVESIVNLINDLDDPVILLGDFNSEPESGQMQLLYDIGMRNAYLTTHTNFYPATTFSGESIDFVLYRGLSLLSSDVLTNEHGSDHFPVLAEFSVPS
ncbi:MAG: endonuclease/exonuclease/phosphatase family protein, partial [Candidatus Kariarchaeaceae archaeon]